MLAYKIVMVGDFGVGKTSLVSRFVDNSFSEEYLSSIGVSISKKKCYSSDIESTMMLWDIEGKTDYKPIFTQYLTGAKAFIIVADLTREETFQSIEEHVALCLKSSKNAPIAIALNKSDLETRLYKSIKDIQNISPNIILVCKTSAKDGTEVENIFNHINKAVALSI